MTTVGFGDFYAVTYFGRTVSVLAVFMGTFLVSLMVVTLSSSSKFKVNQQKGFNSLISIVHFQKKKIAAARYILHFLRFRHLNFKLQEQPLNVNLYTRREDQRLVKDKYRNVFKSLYNSVAIDA